MRADYHMHSSFSMDCEMPMDELCQAAIAAGLDEICLTEHLEIGHYAPDADIPPEMPKYLAAIEEANEKYPQLTIRSGLEIGDIPEYRKQQLDFLNAWPLDFHLLSKHLIFDVDPYYVSVTEKWTMQEFYCRYLEEMVEELHAWDPKDYDSMAHLGYCAKFSPYPPEERPMRYNIAPDYYDEIFRILAQNGKGLEINTSGVRIMDECIPDRELLKRYVELGGEFVTIGSDAHFPYHVGNHNDRARELAKSCGLRYMLTFEKRRPKPILL